MEPVGKPPKNSEEELKPDKSGLDKIFSQAFHVTSVCLDAILKLGSLPTFLTSYAFSSLTAEFIQFVIHSTSANIYAQTAKAYKQGLLTVNENLKDWLGSIGSTQARNLKENVFGLSSFFVGTLPQKKQDEFYCNEKTFRAIFKGPPGTSENTFLGFTEKTLIEKIGTIDSETESDKVIADGLTKAIVKLGKECERRKIPQSKEESLLCVLERKETLYFANVGNSRAILVNPKTGTFKQLTEDVDPKKKSIKLNSAPNITKVMRKKSEQDKDNPEEGIIYAEAGEYIVLASSELWEQTNNQRVAKAIQRMHEGEIAVDDMGIYIIDAMRDSPNKGHFAIGVFPVKFSPLSS